MSLNIANLIIQIPVLLFALTIHEYAHGRAALWQGDTTAQRMGRLTLNPLPHIDIIGAIFLLLFHFGWAKPVPVNPGNFKNVKQGIIIMALMGPLANIFTAFIAGSCIRFLPIPWEVCQLILLYSLYINLGLGLFNLLPLPPLDGSHILENMLSPSSAEKYRTIGRYGPFILLGIMILDSYAHTGILSSILTGPIHLLAHFFAGI